MFNRLHRTLALVMLMSVLGLVLAACGGGTGGTGGTAESPAASIAAGGEGTTASPSAAASVAAEASPSVAAAASPSAAASPAGGASPSAAGSPGGAAAAACPDSAKGQQIVMWSPLTGPDGDEMTGLANQFSGDNPQGIKVTHTPQPDYLQKLNTAAAGGSLPDMTVIRIYDIGEMALRNVVKPLSEEALGIIGGGDDFPEAVWGAGEFRGQRYAVPLDIHPLVLYYNKDMFQQAGITVPTDRPMTKEEFESAVQTLTKDGVAGVSIGTAFQTGALFQGLIRQFGGELVNDDGTEATYNGEEGVEALTYIRDLKQRTTPQVNGAGDPEVKVFQQGKAAMVMHGPWHISDMVKLPFVGFAPLPQIGEKFSVWGGSHQLALTTDDPAKQAAGACWIGWLSQNSIQWAKAGQIPARTAVRESAELATVSAPVAGFAVQADAVEFLPQVPGIEAAVWGQGFEPAVNDVLLGKQQDIKAALDAQAAKTNQLLKQNAEKYK